MSWKDKAARAVKAPAPEPTKPTEAPFVSFVSTPPAPFSSAAAPGSALAEVSELLTEEGEGELLAAILKAPDPKAEARKAKALAILQGASNVKRVCIADTTEPERIILTIAIRDPWGAVELSVDRSRFDPMALMELAERYRDTALDVQEH